MILFIAATRLTTAANAIFLQYTAPVYVAIAGHRWLRERTLRIDWILIPVALGGIALFFLDHLSASGLRGNLLALGSGVAFAANALLLRRDRDGSPATTILLGNVLAVAITLPALLTSPRPAAGPWLLLLLALGVFQLALPYLLYAVAIKSVTALEATLLPLLEPVLNPLWVMLALGEKPHPFALLGGAVVLATVLLRGALKIRGPRRSAPAAA